MGRGFAGLSEPLKDDSRSSSRGRTNFVKTYFPITGWLPGYKWRELLMKDMACGLTLGCVLIAQSLAHAALCGVSPIHGPYSCLAAPIVYAIMGTCHQASVGTGGLIALLTGIQLRSYEDPEVRAVASNVLCLLVGLILSGMGVLQLSFLVRFLSRPALSGFITGSALLIMKTMTLPMLGLPKPLENLGFAVNFVHQPSNLLQYNPYTLGLSTAALIFLSVAPYFPAKIVREFKELLALILTAGFCYKFGNASGVEVVGAVPQGLPMPQLPIMSGHHLVLAKELVPSAFLIATVTFISSFAAAKKCALKGEYHVVALNELLGLGFGNVAGACLGAVPTQIGLSRSALASGMGVKSQLGSNIFVAVVISTILLLFGPLLALIPICVLNAIIFKVATHLFEFGQLRSMWKQGENTWTMNKDIGIWLVGFFGTLVLGAFEGILVTVSISLVLAIQEVVNPNLDILGLMKADQKWVNIKRFPEARQWTKTHPEKLVVRIDGPLFYANCERFQDTIADIEFSRQEPLRVMVLSASAISFIDATSLQILTEIAKSFKERGILFYIADSHGEARILMESFLGKNGYLNQEETNINVNACMELAEKEQARLQENGTEEDVGEDDDSAYGIRQLPSMRRTLSQRNR